MKPFSTVAIPHKDILEGRLTMDVFAADLWEVYKGRAPEEYLKSDIFFRKTYLTHGLKNLLEVAEKRLRGESGDSIIQLHTPFGGGKTHALIALYHKVKDWKAKVVVIDGTALDPKNDILWEEMEKQLTGKVEKLKGNTSPGKNNLREFFNAHQPLMILMDEILAYATKASGIQVGESSLASQVLTFIHELTATISTLPNSILFLTLPSSHLEHYDEGAEKLFQQLQKITGRTEKIYSPVQEEEIAHIIRRRLFSNIVTDEAGDIVEGFLSYAERERLLPEGVEKSYYRDKFLDSYPFQPEVIDVLYKRWGSFPTFQRTRGVLRLLSLVVHSLKHTTRPYIRVADFDLKNDELRRELIKHIGNEYDSIIAQDITSAEAGSKKVDKSLGDAYLPYFFGSKVATSIFLYSFSGGPERGATISDIKLACSDMSTPSSIVVETVDKLIDTLFYISEQGLFFTNQPNLNHILLTRMDSLSSDMVKTEEKRIIFDNLKKDHFDIYIWPDNPKDIPDDRHLKLIVLRDSSRAKEILHNYGERPRIYCNTLIFLCPLEGETIPFENYLKRKIAWQMIERDGTLRLSAEQKREVKSRRETSENEVRDRIRRLYRTIWLPVKDGLKELDLGIPTYKADASIVSEIYERLRSEGEILDKFSPIILKEKYLKNRDFVDTKSVNDSLYSTPGEIRIINENVLANSIKEGVKIGLFGAGYKENSKPKCTNFKDDYSPSLVEGEVLIIPDLCEPQKPLTVTEEQLQKLIVEIRSTKTPSELNEVEKKLPLDLMSQEMRDKIYVEVKKRRDELPTDRKVYKNINLELNVPQGKISDVAKMVGFIKTKFQDVNTSINISATNGEIPISDYENTVEETIKQANIQIIKEDKN
ncbi:MAG: hypothetical protein DDT23_00712 [candidate division WS2 bacterium]|nr:hypothetical protein [Candidatus Lithacetigena glycinireducens]